MRRAELTLDTVAQLVLVIVVIAIAGLIVTMLWTMGAQPDQACKLSAGIQRLTSAGGLNSPFELYCPRKVLTVEDEKVSVTRLDLYRRGLRLEKQREHERYAWADYEWAGSEARYGIGRISDENLQHDLESLFVYELAECWDTFHRGAADVLNDESTLLDSNVCVICAEIRVEKPYSGVLHLERELEDPHHFLNTSRYTSYRDLIYNNDPPSESLYARENIQPGTQLAVSSNENYAVFFVRRGSQLRRGGESVNKAMAALPGPVRVVAVGAVGAVMGAAAGPWGALIGAVGGVANAATAGSINEKIGTQQTVLATSVLDMPQVCDVVVN